MAGGSELVAAAYRHDWDAVAVLHEAAEDLTVHEAAVVGDVDALEARLAEDPGCLESVADDGFRPLHLAAYFARPAAVELLLARGADPDAIADQPTRLRPLHAGCAGRDPQVVELLLEGGARPNRPQQGGHTPLMAAALHGDTTIVELLLQHGARVDLRDDEGISARDRATGDTVGLLSHT